MSCVVSAAAAVAPAARMFSSAFSARTAFPKSTIVWMTFATGPSAASAETTPLIP
ncbi:MAG: hypothetical protein QM651_13650 [Rhodoblastus sp.]